MKAKSASNNRTFDQRASDFERLSVAGVLKADYTMSMNTQF